MRRNGAAQLYISKSYLRANCEVVLKSLQRSGYYKSEPQAPHTVTLL